MVAQVRASAMIGQDTQLPHTLVPLALAVAVVRSRTLTHAAAVPPDANGLATFIASVVPVFEYFENPSWLPCLLDVRSHDGVLRAGGAELRFTDGRVPKRRLAVQANDVECVIDMLNNPEGALRIRARALSAASARIRRRSQAARSEAARLRAIALHAMSKAALLSTRGGAAICGSYRNAHRPLAVWTPEKVEGALRISSAARFPGSGRAA